MTRGPNRRSLLTGFAAAALSAAVPASVWAQQPAPTENRSAELGGRLFFTPVQRVQLDIARKQRARATLSRERTEEVAQPIPQTITYDGVVRRSDGKTTVWVNGRPINDRQPVGGAAIVGRIGTDGSVVLQVPQSGRSVTLKPGQRVELLSGTIEEGYQRTPPLPKPKPAARAGAGGSASRASPSQESAGPGNAATNRPSRPAP